MMVTVDQIERGIINYADQEIGRKASGVTKFGVYFMLPVISKRLRSAVDAMRNIDPSVFDHNGNVDIDVVKARAKEAMDRCGTVEYAGIRFSDSDIDSVVKFILEV